jgi:alpha-1,6-mannosyltransferase
VGVALVSERIADHLEPGHGPLVLAAIGLNPLLLVEGPGSGHNDLSMMLALSGGVLLVLRGRFLPGAAVAGLSVAIKLVTLPALAWLIIVRLRAPGSARARITEAVAAVALAIVPTLVLQSIFQGNGALVSALLAHLGAHAAPGTTGGALLAQRWPLALAFVAACGWVWWSGRAPTIMTTWVLFASLLIVAGLDVWYPWYATWVLVLALVRWRGAPLALVIAANTFALTLMSFYARLK